MENNFDFDYTNFDPEKEYEVKNDKASLSHKELLARQTRPEKLHEWQKGKEGQEFLNSKMAEIASDTFKKWHAENPEESLAQKKHANKVLREKRPDHQSKAGSVGGKKTKENGAGIFGIPQEEMQEYRMRGVEAQRQLGIGLFRERSQEEKDALKLAAAKWKEENPEEVAKGFKQWREENPELAKQISQDNMKKALEGAKEKWFGTEKHKELVKKNTDLFKSNIECPHCGKSGNYSNQKRWHFDNCKLKAPFELMPDNKEMTKAELLDLFNSNGLNMDIKAVTRFIFNHPKVSIVGKPLKGANGKSAPKYRKLKPQN